MERLENNLDSPRILSAKKLGNVIDNKVQVDVMDFGNTRTKSHKGIKAKHGLDYVQSKGGDYALIITSGNAGPAFDVVSKDYENIQVVKFVNKGLIRKPINIIELGKDKQGKDKYGITIQLPDKWFNSKQLKSFWKKVINGSRNPFSAVNKYQNCSDFEKLINIVDSNNLDVSNSFDVTNLRGYSKDKSPYLIDEVKNAVKKYDYIFVPFGSGELFTGFQEAARNLWFGKPKLLAVTSEENPISLKKQQKPVNGIRLRKRKRKSHADKLDTPRVGRDHIRSVKMADKNTYFCSLPDAFVDRAYRFMGEYEKLNTTKTGSICAGVFSKENLEVVKNGFEVQNTYRFDPMKVEFYTKKLVMKPLTIKNRKKVLVVNTGGMS